jgi:hypothetical protein
MIQLANGTPASEVYKQNNVTTEGRKDAVRHFSCHIRGRAEALCSAGKPVAGEEVKNSRHPVVSEHYHHRKNSTPLHPSLYHGLTNQLSKHPPIQPTKQEMKPTRYSYIEQISRQVNSSPTNEG